MTGPEPPSGGKDGEKIEFQQAHGLLPEILKMAVHDVKPLNPHYDPEDTVTGDELTLDEYVAIRAAAEAEGYSEIFGDLLCRFAELIGPDQVLLELEQLKDRLKDGLPH
jgi:hypothetical protein